MTFDISLRGMKQNLSNAVVKVRFTAEVLCGTERNSAYLIIRQLCVFAHTQAASQKCPLQWTLAETA